MSSTPFVPSFGEDYINLVLSGTIKKYHKLESYSSYQTLNIPYISLPERHFSNGIKDLMKFLFTGKKKNDLTNNLFKMAHLNQ